MAATLTSGYFFLECPASAKQMDSKTTLYCAVGRLIDKGVKAHRTESCFLVMKYKSRWLQLPVLFSLLRYKATLSIDSM